MAGANRRAGFTLMELVVVIAILVLLVSISVPAVMQAVAVADRAKCAANLHDLGIAITHYRIMNGNRFPDAAQMPSVTPQRPSLVAALREYTEGSAIFHCPADTQYYPTEGLSYEYPARIAGRTLEEVQSSRRRRRSSDRIWVLHDFDHVHGSAGNPWSRVFLYADGHVK